MKFSPAQWNINRKISISTVVAVAVSIALLVIISSQQSKTKISNLAKQNYTLISELLTKQAGGAMRWKKVKLIKAAYQHIAEQEDSTLSNLIAYDTEGNIIHEYKSKTIPTFDITTLSLNKTSELSITETNSHLIMAIPAFSGKKRRPVGSLVMAWSQHKINQEIANSQLKNTVLGLVIIIVLSVLLSFLVKMIIIKPLNEVIVLTKDLAEGEGDLSKRITLNRNDELAELAKWINIFIKKVQHLVSQIQGSSTQLSNESASLAVNVDSGNSALEEQKRDIDQVATAMNEMTATVSEVANNASAASDSAKEASDASNTGQSVVRANIESIRSLASEVDSAGSIIESLAEDTQSIGSVLDVIRGIAEQTNLLALNAAIEAARAGEQGRGFAVVADEVRTLASRTQESTQEIQQMIERLQSGAKNAVEAMHKGKDKASHSVEHSTNVQEALSSITSLISQITDMNTQIATAAREQNDVAEDINRNIVNVHTLFESNVEISQKSAVSGNIVSNLAQELQSMISQFKV